MEDKKIYLVTSGTYSDYGIDAVFTTRELAQAFIDSFEKSFYIEIRIEERILNPKEKEIRKGFKAYFVRMTKKGQVKDCYHSKSSYCFVEGKTFSFDIDDNLYCHVFAKDDKHAIKIVNEKRGQLIALDRWGRELNK